MRSIWFAFALALAPAAARAAEPLALTDLDGKPVALAPAPDAALVLHFWATWCPTCKEELGVLARVAHDCAGAKVEVVAVDIGETAEEVADYKARNPFELRVLLDPKGRAWRGSGGREVPANLTWTSKQEGEEERSWALGPSSEAQWRERLAALGCTSARDD